VFGCNRFQLLRKKQRETKSNRIKIKIKIKIGAMRCPNQSKPGANFQMTLKSNRFQLLRRNRENQNQNRRNEVPKSNYKPGANFQRKLEIKQVSASEKKQRKSKPKSAAE
jgi:hypothetical protein